MVLLECLYFVGKRTSTILCSRKQVLILWNFSSVQVRCTYCIHTRLTIETKEIKKSWGLFNK